MPPNQTDNSSLDWILFSVMCFFSLSFFFLLIAEFIYCFIVTLRFSKHDLFVSYARLTINKCERAKERERKETENELQNERIKKRKKMIVLFGVQKWFEWKWKVVKAISHCAYTILYFLFVVRQRNNLFRPKP